ncbi:MAG: lamin tail domain-containing protein [Methanosarcinales archaeon]|nr:lamin tail domain-containing protein [Methanosarcinales archaeon]
MHFKILLFICSLALLMVGPSALGGMVVNELELNPPDDAIDWVELYNAGDEAVDIGLWTAVITDGSWKGEIQIPNGTVLEPGQFYLASGQRSWNHGDSGYAYLLTANGTKVDETAMRTDSMGNDMTWGRHPDGHDTDTDGDWGLSMASPGKSNS